MPDFDRSVAHILHEARETLRTAQHGLDDLRGQEPARRLPGLRNAIVFGRAVTNVLENLRSRVEDFDDWYKAESARLSRDPGYRRLYEMRSEILKRGQLSVGNSVHIGYLDTADLQPLMQNPPRGARGFFIGDQNGGSGWEVELPSGETEKYYVKLPASVDATFSYGLATRERDEDAADLVERYLDEMKALINEARRRFQPVTGSPDRSA